MNARNLRCLLLLCTLVPGCCGQEPFTTARYKPAKSSQGAVQTMFLPPSLNDQWTQWILGEWAGSGDSSAGKGRCRVSFELGLGGQFLVARSQAEITELEPDYLTKHMNASDEEIQRFVRSGYESLEFYTLDQESGDVLGFLFDNLRCIATGRGKREGFKEVIQWEWRNGYRSTRVTERSTQDRFTILEQTPQPDGTVMQDRAEMTRVKN